EKAGRRPGRVVHAWGLEPAAGRDAAACEALGFASLLHLDRALGEGRNVPIDLLLTEAQEVTGGEPVVPAKAAVLGWCAERRAPRSPEREVRSLDVVAPPPSSGEEERLAAQLARDLRRDAREPWIAYRGGLRWARRLRRVAEDAATSQLFEGP